MGWAVARAALRQGHETVLVAGPVCLAPPEKAEVVSVITAKEMLAAIQRRIDWCDALVMAAAVCDWRPRSTASQKIKKMEMTQLLQLKPTPDILRTLRPKKKNRIFVGFAAETRDLLKAANQKLTDKALDLIVANDVSRTDSGFETDTNQVLFVYANGQSENLPLLSKDEVAERIINWIESKRAAAALTH